MCVCACVRVFGGDLMRMQDGKMDWQKMQGWRLWTQSNKDTPTVLRARSHARRHTESPNWFFFLFGTSKASQRLTKCEATTRRGCGVKKVIRLCSSCSGGWHCDPVRADMTLPDCCARAEPQKQGRALHLLHDDDDEEQRKTRLQSEPITRRAQTVNTQLYGWTNKSASASFSVFSKLSWNSWFFHPTADNPFSFDWER